MLSFLFLHLFNGLLAKKPNFSLKVVLCLLSTLSAVTLPPYIQIYFSKCKISTSPFCKISKVTGGSAFCSGFLFSISLHLAVPSFHFSLFVLLLCGLVWFDFGGAFVSCSCRRWWFSCCFIFLFSFLFGFLHNHLPRGGGGGGWFVVIVQVRSPELGFGDVASVAALMLLLSPWIWVCFVESGC